MTTDPTLYLTFAAAALAAVGMTTTAALSGWRGWLALKHQELVQRSAGTADAHVPSAGTRIEIADLKERIRKLEAIAAGVDL